MNESKIQWTDHTFNPWIGCQNVSPGCDNCYAEALMAERFKRVEWGPHGTRKLTSDANWKTPIAWNRKGPARVFCASLADVFDNRAPDGGRERLWALVRQTPRLEWLLLTKRPQNIARMLPEDWPLPNARLGVTAENQTEADRRLPILAAIPHALRPFVSAEPLLGPVDLMPWLPTIGWVIAGGESGHGGRPMNEAWVRGLRDQCQSFGAAFFYKQRIVNGRKQELPALDGRRWIDAPADSLCPGFVKEVAA